MKAGTADVRMENLDGASGMVFRVDPEKKRFEFLKETAFDPKTNEGRSRYPVYWHSRTRFVKVVRQNDFAGLEGEKRARIRPFDDENALAAKEGREFVTLHVTLLAEGETEAGWPQDAHHLLVPFTPDPESPKFREGTVRIEGHEVPVRLRGPRAEVDIRTVVPEQDLQRGFWGATIHGHFEKDRFLADRIDLYPKEDPREVDDPALPRILVIGDSISMNYHAAAKESLKGVANYYRIDGNGGPSDRGVVCMELWLGDYTQPGLQWDVIQFNHGLHDLKQPYDEETGEYADTYQVPLDDYKQNLEREIQIMKRTGARLVWCTTTPVPNNSFGTWATGTAGRKKDADLIFNKAAKEVMDRHPEILINDLNHVIRSSSEFDGWRKQKDVHYWDGSLQKVVGQAVAEFLKGVVEKHTNAGLPGAPK